MSKLSVVEMEMLLAVDRLPNLHVNHLNGQPKDCLVYSVTINRDLYVRLIDNGYLEHGDTTKITAKGLEVLQELRKSKVEKVG